VEGDLSPFFADRIRLEWALGLQVEWCAECSLPNSGSGCLGVCDVFLNRIGCPDRDLRHDWRCIQKERSRQ
jgi:hypothetical protein